MLITKSNSFTLSPTRQQQGNQILRNAVSNVYSFT